MMTISKLKEIILSKNKEQSFIADNLILLHNHGSRLYGTDRPDSDYDYRGITIAPRDYWVGARDFEQFEYQEQDVDIVIYDIRKWLKLVYYNNPNIIESVFVGSDNPAIIHTSEEWNFIRDRASHLMSKLAHQAFSGYTFAQIKKVMIKQNNKNSRQYIKDEFGFDIKFAMHAFRLAREGCELLTTGKITLPRPDCDFLKQVRNGEIYNGFQDMDRCLTDLKVEHKKLDQALEQSSLPKCGDFSLYNDTFVEIFNRYVK